MRLFAVLSTFVCALALPAVAVGGGWASVGFEPLPDGTAAGEAWKPTIVIKQHGVTPLDGLHPVVMIEDASSGTWERFPAAPAGEPGAYTADVAFPYAGDWRVTIEGGFSASQTTYGPFAVAAGRSGGGTESLPVVGFGAVALAIAGAFALFAVRRGRRVTPASS